MRNVASAPLDLRDTSALKTVGILAIVLHNFFHSLPGAGLENEFSFHPGNLQKFLALVVDPRQTIQSLFAYLGHFGVQLFIFVSAYGLALRYPAPPSWKTFVWGRIRKIYPMYFLALGAFLLLRAVEHGSTFPQYLIENGDDLLLTTLAVINVAPGYGLPPVGPWWFLAFIVQFYCLWPALAALSRRYGGRGLLAVSVLCLAATMGLSPILTERWGINLMQTPIGHMPELCLGVACARYGVRIGPFSALLAVPVFILGNLYTSFWLLTFLSALVILVYLYSLTAGLLRRTKLIDRIAEVSMPLFFVNGFLRSPFRRVAIQFDRLWSIELAMGIAFTLFSLGVSYVMLRIERRLVPGETRPKNRPAGA